MTRSLTTLATLATLAFTGCVGGPPRRPADRPSEVIRDITPVTANKPALDGKRITDFGLEEYWDSFIRGEVIVRMQLEGNSLYAITESNRIYQVDCHSGRVNWVFEAGLPIQFLDAERPIAEWAYPKKQDDQLLRYDEVYFLAKDTLFALDKKGGSELWRLTLPFGASAPPQPSATHVFVGSWDDWVYAVKKSSQPITWDWKWRTGADILARPAVESPYVFVASSDGLLYTLDAVKGEMQGEPFHTQRPLSADPLVHRNLLYLGGQDMALYAIGVNDGRIHYKFEAGAPIKKRPVAIGPEEVYVVTERGPGDKPEDPRHGVSALVRKGIVANKTAHEPRWTRVKAEKVLARGKDNVYLLEPDDKGTSLTKKVVKLDAKEGYFRDSLNAENVDFFVTNAYDPNRKTSTGDHLMGGIVFFGFRNGWIVALKEKSEF